MKGVRLEHEQMALNNALLIKILDVLIDTKCKEMSLDDATVYKQKQLKDFEAIFENEMKKYATEMKKKATLD